MDVLYSKGSKIDRPDALSRLQYEVSSRSQELRDWALRLGKEPDTSEFEVTEAFPVTRSSRKAQTPATDVTPLEHAAQPPTNVAPVERTVNSGAVRQQGLAIVPSEACKQELRQAVCDSARFSAIRDRLLEADRTIVDGKERYELPETCQYILHDGILYLNDPITRNMRLVLANQHSRSVI
jgi:hypothetical protein